MMRYIGIDPGLGGAVAILPEGHIFDTPTAQVGRKRDYLPAQMAALLLAYISADAPVAVAIESVHSMPKQGVASAFNFGCGLGIWLGILAALAMPYDRVSPQRWKRVMLDGMGKEKDAARVRAMQLFPELAAQLSLKKHHGRAEALLLAEYRRRLG